MSSAYNRRPLPLDFLLDRFAVGRTTNQVVSEVDKTEYRDHDDVTGLEPLIHNAVNRHHCHSAIY